MVTEYSRKFKVPKNQKINLTDDSMGAIYLWPGLSSEMDLIQPCLELDKNWDQLPLKQRQLPCMMVIGLISRDHTQTIGKKIEVP